MPTKAKIQFTKISQTGKSIAIHWKSTKKTASDIDENETVQLECPERPRPEFDKALQTFLPFLLTIVGAPADWKQNTEIRGISINKEEDGRRGIVITASRKCPYGAAPIALNSPHLREALDDTTETSTQFFLPKMADAIDDLCEEAQAYVDGERAQGQLFDVGKKKGPQNGELELVGSVMTRGKQKADAN